MKAIVERIANVMGNLNNGPVNGYTQVNAVGDLAHIIDDIEAYVPPGITEAEYNDVQKLNEIAIRNAKEGDGQDQDFVHHLQDAQKIIMTRAGSRTWVAMNEAKGDPI